MTNKTFMFFFSLMVLLGNQAFAGNSSSKSKSTPKPYYKAHQTYRQHCATGVCALASHAIARGLHPGEFIHADSKAKSGIAPLTAKGVSVLKTGQQNFIGVHDSTATIQQNAGPGGDGTAYAALGFAEHFQHGSGVLQLFQDRDYHLVKGKVSGGPSGHAVAYRYSQSTGRYTVHDTYTGIAHEVDSHTFHSTFKDTPGYDHQL